MHGSLNGRLIIYFILLSKFIYSVTVASAEVRQKVKSLKSELEKAAQGKPSAKYRPTRLVVDGALRIDGDIRKKTAIMGKLVIAMYRLRPIQLYSSLITNMVDTYNIIQRKQNKLNYNKSSRNSDRKHDNLHG